MSNLIKLSVVSLLAAMTAQDISPVEVVAAYCDRIEEINPSLNAIVTLRRAEALQEAREAERIIRQGQSRPLTGLPFTVKDTIETAGIRTTAGSKSRSSVVPQCDAPAVASLRAQGAIILGKSNTPEFAMTFATDNALFGRTANPWDLALSPGGSSGGEAAIIAANGSPLGLGSDLGGSIRIPANFCRVAGLRPTVGRQPAGGHIPALQGPLGPLSVIGPLARRVADIDAVMFHLVQDWSNPQTETTGHRTLRSSVATVGFFEEDGVVPVATEVKASVRAATAALEDSQWSARPVIPPNLADLYDLWDELWDASGGARGLLSGYQLDETMLSPALAKLFALSPEAPDEPRMRAAELRLKQCRDNMARFMETSQVIICPVAAGPPTERVGQWNIDGLELRGGRGFGYSYVWSLLGFPALALPNTWSSAVTGIQIVARPGCDEQAVAVGRYLEDLQERGS